MLHIHIDGGPANLALRNPSLDLRLELGIGDDILEFEPEMSAAVTGLTHGTLLNGSTSLERRCVRMVLRSITTRDTGSVTGSRMTTFSRA
jgi:hypothetical protein